MEKFKQELQKLIDDAAEKSANENYPPIHPAWEGTENQIFNQGFSYGCEFLLPMIDSLIKCRDVLLHENDKLLNYEKMKLSDRNDKDLLNLLRGEK